MPAIQIVSQCCCRVPLLPHFRLTSASAAIDGPNVMIGGQRPSTQGKIISKKANGIYLVYPIYLLELFTTLKNQT